MLHGMVVAVVGSLQILGRNPETVPAADHPFCFAASAELVRVGFKDILPTGGREVQDSGPHIESHHELEVAVGKMQIPVPAGVG